MKIPPGLREIDLTEDEAKLIENILDDSNYPTHAGKEMPDYEIKSLVLTDK